MRKTLFLPLLGLLVAPLALPQSAPQPPAPTPAGQMRLTIADAEQLALKNNPQISVAQLLTLAQHEVTREQRAAEMPTAAINLTAADAHSGSRLAAGALNNPIIYPRAAAGVNLSQLIFDFGRTHNLVQSAKFREQAQVAAQNATNADIMLAVDQAFYSALDAQSTLDVAKQTVNARQTTTDQVQALTTAKLKSDLDLSFANVNLAQAKLLLLDAENRQSAAFADLNTLLGFEKQQAYLLVDETAVPPAPAPNVNDLINMAFQTRPDLIELNNRYEAAERYRRAEHDLNRPSISALAAFGDTPVRADQLTPWYGAAGVNLNIPVFNGFLFSARAKQADYEASAAQQQVRDLRNRIARDVQVTWLQSATAYQKLAVSQQLLQQANLALDLAQTRYKLGLSSIVELSQAQLQQTQAAIGNAAARYDYESTLAALRFQTGK
jgi:outer membrane protein